MKAKISHESTRRAIADETARKMARQILAEQTSREELRYNTILAYVLHTEFEFGRGRIMRLLKGIIDGQAYTLDRYGAKYRDAAFAELLRRDGIDMGELQRELDAYADEVERGLDTTKGEETTPDEMDN